MEVRKRTIYLAIEIGCISPYIAYFKIGLT